MRVDIIASPDSDVFPFGAGGCVLKTVSSDGACAWHIEFAEAAEVFASLGFGQQGVIALASLAGCDFSPHSARGVGIEKALRCVDGMLRHCDEATLKDFLLVSLDAASDGGLPLEVRSLTSLVGCSTCRKCGHGTVGKPQHGRLGCADCGTLKSSGGNGGCLPRTGPCQCPFHRRYDEVVLARTLASKQALPSPSAVRKVWAAYEPPALAEYPCVTWKRPGPEAAARFLSGNCGSDQQATATYMMASLLAWDMSHPDDPQAQFVPSAVVGECAVNLGPGEKSSPSNLLAVLQWAALPGRDVSEGLVQVANDLPRAKRSVNKRLATRFCPELVEAHCRAELSKKMRKPQARKNQDWHAEARALCVDSWGLREVPAAITGDVDKLTLKRADKAGQETVESTKKQKTLAFYLRGGRV